MRLQLIIFAVLFGSAVVAQDVTVTVPALVDQREIGETQPPTFIKPLRIQYPSPLRGSDETGYAIVSGFVDAKGRVDITTKHVRASNPHFLREAGGAFGFPYRLRPATKEGQPIAAEFWSAVIFNPSTASPDAPNAAPRILGVAPLFVPKGIFRRYSRADTPPFWATVEIDSGGQLVGLTIPEAAERFRAVIEDSLSQWTFNPARRAGHSVAGELRVPLVFLPRDEQAAEDLSIGPKALKTVKPHYPGAMYSAGIRGDVMLEVEVGEQGKVQEVSVLRSNHRAFEEPAMEAVRQWTFEPARRGGEPIVARLEIPIIFHVDSLPGGGKDPRGETCCC